MANKALSDGQGEGGLPNIWKSRERDGDRNVPFFHIYNYLLSFYYVLSITLSFRDVEQTRQSLVLTEFTFLRERCTLK
jgi:hypothetical protein